jgi:3-deoxy-D-manno-octulosonate 8-phosphate phosphatase (KDO 8-P phosphatase)
MKEISLDVVRNLKAFAFDVDGVLFPNENWWFSNGVFAKRRSLYDGQGISLLRAVGFHVAFITSARGDMAKPIQDLVEGWNKLPSTKSESNPSGWEMVTLFDHQDSLLKKETLFGWLNSIGVEPGQCGAMGDDLVDIPMLSAAGFSASPRQAEHIVRERSHFVSEREGGEGAIRDVVNYILNVRNIDPTTLHLR